MKSSELHAETQRLIALSDSLVYQVHQFDNVNASLTNQLSHGALALAFAALTAWVATWFGIEKDFRNLIFVAQIILYGCFQIAAAVTQSFAFFNKLLDNINALRVVMIDMSNKLGYMADKP